MKYIKTIVFLLSSVLSGLLDGQEVYFQQDVAYDINVTLDESQKMLHGDITIEYTNNSPKSLDKIYMHLWPNAYKNKSTTFAKEYLKGGNRAFQFAPKEDYGFIDSLDFYVDGHKIAWQKTKDPDIAILILPKDLESGGSILISTSFRVKVPASFSRMGVKDNTYQITQWYPKPAVYDREGWHPIPYINMGEFYSEFGSFDVKINIPKHYKLAATGSIVESIVKNNRKTIQFSANNIHDFAWLASPDFIVTEKEIMLSSGNEIMIKCFTDGSQEDKWKNCLALAERAIRYFSEEIGEYPYSNYSVVHTTLKAGGGMEYPMLTVIDDVNSERGLDEVVAHEIAHSWFYGILGFNERKYPWMDEGLTSYYTSKYVEKEYEQQSLGAMLPSFLSGDTESDLYRYFYQGMAFRHYDQAPGLASKNYNYFNYGLASYVKPTFSFDFLAKYLGEEKMKSLIQSFYEKWKYKHPQPYDLRVHFEEQTDKDLSWLFDGLLGSDETLDYGIKHKDEDGNSQFKVDTHSTLRMPYKVTGYKDEKVVFNQWYEPNTLSEWHSSDEKVDYFIVDKNAMAMDINYKNNKSKKSIKFGFGAGLDTKYESKQIIAPTLLFNHYDGIMAGLAINNTPVPIKKWQYIANVNYAFRSQRPVINWVSRYNWYMNKKGISHLHFDLNVRAHLLKEKDDVIEQLSYTRISPALQYTFNSDINSAYLNTLSIRSNHILRYSYDLDKNIEQDWSNIYQIGYKLDKKSTLRPFFISLDLEQQSYKLFDDSQQHYLKLTTSFNGKMYYNQSRKIHLRLFAGGFLDNTRREVGSTNRVFVRGTIPLTYQGFNDYTYSDYFFGRFEQTGIWSQQVVEKAGGFKNALTSQFASFGQTNNFMLTANFKVEIPKLPSYFPLMIYADVGIYSEKSTSIQDFERKGLFSGGLALEWADRAFAIYLPVFYSSGIKSNYQTIDANFFERISFTMDINKLNPWVIIDKLGRQ